MAGRTVAIGLVTLALAMAPARAAEDAGNPVNRSDVECTTPSEDHATAKSIYSAHVAFNMMYNALTARCKAAAFADRVRGIQPDGSKLTDDDVFEAATPPMTFSEKLAYYAAKAKEGVRRMFETDAERTERVDRAMREGIYVAGEFDKDGFPRGYNLTIDKSGTMQRGTFENGKLSGAGEVLRADGEVSAGTFRGGEMEGPGARQNPKGTVLEGTFDGDRPVGTMVAVFPDGSRQTQTYAADGRLESTGPLIPKERAAEAGGLSPAEPVGPASGDASAAPMPLTRTGNTGRALVESSISSATRYEATRPVREAQARIAAEQAKADAAAAAERSRQQEAAIDAAAQAKAERRAAAAESGGGGGFSSFIGALAQGAQGYLSAKQAASTARSSASAPAADSGRHCGQVCVVQ